MPFYGLFLVFWWSNLVAWGGAGEGTHLQIQSMVANGALQEATWLRLPGCVVHQGDAGIELCTVQSSTRAKFVTLKMPFHGLFLVFWCLNLVARGELWRGTHLSVEFLLLRFSNYQEGNMRSWQSKGWPCFVAHDGRPRVMVSPRVHVSSHFPPVNLTTVTSEINQKSRCKISTLLTLSGSNHSAASLRVSKVTFETRSDAAL